MIPTVSDATPNLIIWLMIQAMRDGFQHNPEQTVNWAAATWYDIPTMLKVYRALTNIPEAMRYR